MEKKLTKKVTDLFQMESAMNAVSNAPGIKFQFLLARNLKTLKSELDLLREKAKNCDEFDEAQKRSEEIKKKFARKDKKGDPKIVQEMRDGRPVARYDIPSEKDEEFKEELKNFWEQEDNKAAMEKQNQIFTEYNEYIHKEELEITLQTIPLSCAPEEFFNKEENIQTLQYFIATCIDLIEE